MASTSIACNTGETNIRAIGIVLVIGTILFFVAGGLGILGVPFLKRRWKAATIVASLLSLLLFAVTWAGILPHPTDAIWGPVISGVLLVGLLTDLFLVHTILRPKIRHVEHKGIAVHTSK